jgi:hypothetical protein
MVGSEKGSVGGSGCKNGKKHHQKSRPYIPHSPHHACQTQRGFGHQGCHDDACCCTRAKSLLCQTTTTQEGTTARKGEVVVVAGVYLLRRERFASHVWVCQDRIWIPCRTVPSQHKHYQLSTKEAIEMIGVSLSCTHYRLSGTRKR